MDWTFQPLTTLGLIAFIWLYGRGSRSVLGRLPGSNFPYILSFVLGILCLGAAMLSPLAMLKHKFLFARSLQQVLTGILAPPLLWQGQAFVCAWQGMPIRVRRGIRHVSQSIPWVPRTFIWATSPGLIWLFTLGVFGLWHDSTIVDWVMPNIGLADAFLWFYFLAFVLFWWHAMAALPRLHSALPIWARIVYLIVGGEIANMVTGISLAFRAEPLFAYYAGQTHTNGLSPLQDQMISGGIIWVTGSFVYVFIAMTLLGQAIFRQRPAPPVPPRDWQTASLDTIAPGLEQRLQPPKPLD